MVKERLRNHEGPIEDIVPLAMRSDSAAMLQCLEVDINVFDLMAAELKEDPTFIAQLIQQSSNGISDILDKAEAFIDINHPDIARAAIQNKWKCRDRFSEACFSSLVRDTGFVKTVFTRQNYLSWPAMLKQFLEIDADSINHPEIVVAVQC